MTHAPTAPALPPPIQMLEMITVGRMTAQAIGIAARLDLATRLADGPLPVAELARSTGSDADALRRVLRALASVGIFAEGEPGWFGNTPLSEALRADAPGSARALALFFCHDVHIQAWLGLDHSVKTGESGFAHVHGASPFEYVVQHPEIGSVFNDAMTAFSATFGPAIAGSYDFGGIETLVDVGGGQGQLLCSILGAFAGVRGVLFDLPHVVDGAAAVIESAGMASRIDVVGGDFFETVPSAGAYLAKNVLHDWNDGDAIRILQTIHRAAAPGARLLLAESVLEPGNARDIVKFMDLEMLVTGGGRERNADEWTGLLGAGGFRLDRVIPTPSPLRLLEATRV